MQIIDQEQRCLDQQLLNQIHINEVRQFFISLLQPHKHTLDFGDFTRFIQFILQSDRIDQNVLVAFYKQLDQNGDGRLEWNEYLYLFINFIQHLQCLPNLKAFPTLQLQKRYLLLLQMEFLTSPFNKLTDSLSSIQKQLVGYEIQQQSNKQIKQYYFLAGQEILNACDLLPEQNIQNLENIDEIIEILYIFIQQRTPHLKQRRAINTLTMLSFIMQDEVLKGLLSQLFTSQSLKVLQALTLLIHCLLLFPEHPFKEQCGYFMNLHSILLPYLANENDQIVQQTLLLLGALTMWQPNILVDLFNYRPQIMGVRLVNLQTTFYHSWYLGCQFGRYQKCQIEEFIISMKTTKDNNLWIQDILTYFKINSQVPLQSENAMHNQIHMNLLSMITPFLATQAKDNQLYQYVIATLNCDNNKIVLQSLSLIKKVFKWPKRLDYLNLDIQVYLFQNNLLSSLLSLCQSGDPIVKEKALKLLIKTLCDQNSQFVIRYLEESNTQQQFIFLILGLHNKINKSSFPETYVHYQTIVLKVLSRFSNESATIFQQIAINSTLTKLLLALVQEEAIPVMQYTSKSIKDYSVEDYVYSELSQFYSSFKKHFQPLFLLTIIDKPTLDVIEQIIPCKTVVESIYSYFNYLLSNPNDTSPLLLRKYLQSIYQNMMNITFDMLSFCKSFKITTSKLLETSAYLETIYEQLLTKQESISDTLMLISSENITKDGNVIVTIYLNEYQADRKCRVILKSNMQLLAFEREVEKGLSATTPLLYLVVNQHHPTKCPYDPTIIDDNTFSSFMMLADKLIDTPQGSVRIPQEIIAVNVFKLTQDDCSMKNICEIIHKGSKFIQLSKIKGDSMLWFLENNSAPQDRAQVTQQIHLISRLSYEQIDNLLDSMLNFFHGKLQLPKINHNEFIDYLQDMSVPFLLAKKIAKFLAKSGLNNPIDFNDFVCFVAVFILNAQDTIILKWIYLLYLDDRGNFGINELTSYLADMFQISKTTITKEQIAKWAQELLTKADQNQDGYLSFFEYHSLLSDPQYKTKLLDPLHLTLCALTQNQSFGYYKRSPIRFY